MGKPKNKSAPPQSLAREACEEYIQTAMEDERHPLHGSCAEMRQALESDFPLFAQDMAELAALALADPQFDGRGHVAAQSVRRMLAKRPMWIHAANDWAGSAGLRGEGLGALSRWISPA